MARTVQNLALDVLDDGDPHRLLATLDPLGIGAVHFDADGTATIANRAFREQLGLGEEAGAPVWDDNWAILDAAAAPLPLDERPHRRTGQTGDGATGTVIGVERRGKGVTWLSVTTRRLPAPVEGGAGGTGPGGTERGGTGPGEQAGARPPSVRPGPVLMTCTDITTAHQDLLAAREMAFRCQAVFDQATVGLALVRDGEVVQANAAFARTRGRTVPETLGQPWEVGVHPEDVAAAWGYLAQVRRGERNSFSLEYRYLNGDANERRAIGHCSPITDIRGDLDGYLVQTIDVTDLRLAEAEADRRAEQLRLLTLASPAGMFELGADRRIVLASARWAEIVGVDEQGALGQRMLQSAHVEDADSLAASFEAAAQQRREWHATYRLVGPTGVVRRVAARAVPRLDAGLVVGWLGTLTDITPWHEAEQALGATERRYERLAAEHSRQRLASQQAESQRLETVGRLASGVAHDFNNLLGVISNYATFLARQADLPERFGPDLAQIQQATARGAELTRQLLLFSRREQLRPERVDLGEAVREMSELLARPLRPTVELTAHTEAGIEVIADPAQISQLLLNLVINARDAMVHGGTIRVSATAAELWRPGDLLGPLPPGQYARLVVADDGPGMSPDVLAHAFEPFFTTKARAESSGLGLATVQGIAELAGGRAMIASVPGEGTTVTVLLPTAPDETGADGLLLSAP